jgi:hypothetical protein
VNDHPPAPPDDDGNYFTEPELSRWQRFAAWLWSWKGVVLALCAAVAIAVGWNASRLYTYAKFWRAKRLIAASIEAGQRGDSAEEMRRLREAYVLFPGSPVTLRAAARYCEKKSDSTALPLYERLLATRDATADDKVRACRLALMTGKHDLARSWLESLRDDPATRELPTVQSLDAERLAIEQSWEPAIALARQAVARAPAGGPEALVLASLLLRRAERTPAEQRAPMQREAVELLGSLAKLATESGAQALTALATLARQPAAASAFAGRDVTPWLSAADTNPSATPRLRTMAWDLALAARPNDPKSVYSGFVARFRNSDLPEQLEAARWLNQHGQFAESLQLSTPQKQTSSDWYLVHLDALAATGDWKGVLASLESGKGNPGRIADALRALFILRARGELRQPVDKAEAWREIQILAQKESTRDQLYIAQYAERMRQPGEAAAIYRRLIELPAGEMLLGQALTREEKLTCYLGLIRAMPDTAPASEVRPLFDKLRAEYPELEEAANDAIYLQLLTGDVKPAMRAELTRLLDRSPALLAYRTTLALLELRAGDPAAAAKVYDGWQIDWNTAQDRFKAVRVAVLTAAGRADEAAALRETIAASRLRPEEAALLK